MSVSQNGHITVASKPEHVDRETRLARFVELLTHHQQDLFTYIDSLMAGDTIVSDILQDTNLALWNHVDQFDFDRQFLPWAYAFAFQHVLAYRKKCARSRLVFNDAMLESISDVYHVDSFGADARLLALRFCLDKLNPKDRTLICDRYEAIMSVKALASQRQCSANQLSVRLYRLRHALAECVKATLALEM
jgi:RNA polymerase sigma-70 factor, ECF subfamily